MSNRNAEITLLSRHPSPLEAFQSVVVDVSATWTGESANWLGRLLPKLGRFLEQGRSISDIGKVGRSDVGAWINAPLSDGRIPSLATRHNRRSAAALGFRVLRDLGVVEHDPTLDLVLPDRLRGRQTRPLTDSEVEAGRAASVWSVSETRLPSIWALAEATATTHEIPRVLARHVNLALGTVDLCGSAKTEPRVARMTEWGSQVLGRRLKGAGSDNESLTYSGEGSAQSMQASSSMALAKTLTTAGLRIDPSVKPESVRGWAGRRIWEQTGRIETAAVALGCSSLDTAAQVIGYDWTDLG